MQSSPTNRACIEVHQYTLDCGKRSIQSVPLDSWQMNMTIEVLVLSFNQLTTLPDDAFARFPQLRILDVSHNQLQSVSTYAFYKRSSIVAACMSHNQLRRFPKALSYAPNIYYVDLSANHLSSISSDELPVAIGTLALENNTISHFTFRLNAAAKSPRILHMADNELTSVTTEFHNSHAPHNLTFIRLRGNDITTISKYAFVHMPNLTYLDVRENPLSCQSARDVVLQGSATMKMMMVPPDACDFSTSAAQRLRRASWNMLLLGIMIAVSNILYRVDPQNPCATRSSWMIR